MQKIKSTFKIILVMGVSYIVTAMSARIFFINNSPIIRPKPQEYIANNIKETTSAIIARLKNTSNHNSESGETQAPMDKSEIAKIIDDRKKEFLSVPMQQVAKGIYAQENNTTSVTTIKTGEIDKIQFNFVIDGEKVTVNIPKIYYDQLGLSEEKIKESLMKERQR